MLKQSKLTQKTVVFLAVFLALGFVSYNSLKANSQKTIDNIAKHQIEQTSLY